MSKDTIIKLAFAGLVVFGLSGFIIYKVYKFKKDKAENISNIEDPSIKGKQEYNEVTDGDRLALMEKVDQKDKIDSSKIKRREVKKEVKNEVKTRVIEKKEEKNESVVQEKLFDKVDRDEKKRDVKREVVKKEEKKEEATVKFNFVIVQDDELNERVQQKDVGSMTDDNVLLFSGKVYGTQKVKTNEPVMLRNTEEFTIYRPKKAKIPAQSILYGTCKLAGNRMFINVTSISTSQGDFGAKIEVYDNDFIKGIFVKEGIETGVEQSSGEVVDQATQVMPNQLAGTVVRTTSRAIQKSLAKQERMAVTLQDGYDIKFGVESEDKKGKR